jgi:hypothetical protein
VRQLFGIADIGLNDDDVEAARCSRRAERGPPMRAPAGEDERHQDRERQLDHATARHIRAVQHGGETRSDPSHREGKAVRSDERRRVGERSEVELTMREFVGKDPRHEPFASREESRGAERG